MQRLVMSLILQDFMPVDLAKAIDQLKKEMNAVVLAHYYQIGDIQAVADYIGDSLGLSRQAAESEADVIVFCGVHFMAETAKILSPDKKVILPDLEAGCSLAESMPVDEYMKFLEQYPDRIVVNYVNSTAAIKALTDYCVTSSNAVELVASLPKGKTIVFGPDKFLGDWVIQETGRDDIVLWEGTCMVHEIFSEQAIVELQQKHPEAQTLVHPECPKNIRDLADTIGSTSKLLGAVKDDPEGTFIVTTEAGILYSMQQHAPKAKLIPAPAFVKGNEKGSCTSCNDCPHMKRNTLQKLYFCMKNGAPEVELSKDLLRDARKPIERMLEFG